MALAVGPPDYDSIAQRLGFEDFASYLDRRWFQERQIISALSAETGLGSQQLRQVIAELPPTPPLREWTPRYSELTFTASEAADVIGVNVRTIRRAIASGQLVATPSPRGALVTRRDLDKYRDDRLRRHASRRMAPAVHVQLRDITVGVGWIARESGLSRSSIRRSIASGTLRALRTPGGHFRVNEFDARVFIQKFGVR